MDKPLSSLDWSLVQAFLAVAEAGSLWAAARALGTSQPTLGRHIAAMQDQLGVPLFQRNPKGLSLTETGSALVAPARGMQEAARQMALMAAGQQEDLAGTVRITASVVMAYEHLPAIIARLRRDAPDIAVELVPSDSSRNLLWREADIAVRMYRPTQLDLITKHIGDIQLGAFAAKSYLAGRPRVTPNTFMQHDMVGYDTSTQIVDGFRDAGVPVSRDFFKVRCDDNLAYLALIRAGCGIGFAQRTLAQTDPEIEEVDLGFPLPTLPVWLTAHQAMRQSPRIRRVWDALDDGLRAVVA
jgi:DNA-binding transcriptional LysR family regulator